MDILRVFGLCVLEFGAGLYIWSNPAIVSDFGLLFMGWAVLAVVLAIMIKVILEPIMATIK